MVDFVVVKWMLQIEGAGDLCMLRLLRGVVKGLGKDWERRPCRSFK